MTDLLLVEDDPAIVTALSDFLKREGFAVTAASGQTEALRLLEGRRYHLALLDPKFFQNYPLGLKSSKKGVLFWKSGKIGLAFFAGV